MNIIPIILSGGSGTRLWPVSRESKPKQFLAFGGEHSLIQETVLRCQSAIFASRPILVCAENHRFLIAEDLRNINVQADILLEPARRNSCAAIAAGCLSALRRSADAVVLVLAADHAIPDQQAFSDAVSDALVDATAGHLVTFGIKPTRPATGYGYILPGRQLRQNGCSRVEAFVEKPDHEKALSYLKDGYLWNSGNFLFKAQSFIDELEKLEPEILAAVNEAHNKAERDLDFLRLEADAFKKSPSISVDYAVMERTDKAAIFPVSYKWSDVGSWEAVWDVMAKTDEGNVVIGDAEIVNGTNNLVHSHGKLTTLVGVSDIAVVTTRDAVLVASKSETEKVKQLVELLQAGGRTEANESLQIFRPWGNYERLDIGDGYQVKRIVVSPGGTLSLQKHRHRAEHWVVVQGRAEITIDDDTSILEPNQSVYVPLGSVHRLANRESEPTCRSY